MKNLGVHIDSTLTFQSQINHLRNTCYFFISLISKARPYITQEAAKSMAHAPVIWQIDYCNGLLINLPKSQIHEIQMIMNHTARLVVGKRNTPDVSVTHILKDLHWLPVAERIEYKILTLVYKTLHGLAPIYLTELLRYSVRTRQLHSRGCNVLQVPRIHNKYGERSFSVAGPILWNKLPA